MKKKFLVTGGCGFIGSHLVDNLASLGHQVTVIDNLSADTDKFHFNESKNVKYIHDDILNFDVVNDASKGCDHVFHLAAESRIGPTLENPIKACTVNFVGTCNILQASRNNGVKSVVYSATSSSYGLAKSFPQVEEDPIDNLNPYAVSKYAGEDLCRMYKKLWGLNAVALRYFNVYGERMPSRGQYAPVIGIFLRQKAANQPLTIVGDGLQSRDFVHVSDVVNANLLAASTPECGGKTYNVGSGKFFSVLEIAKMISENYVHIPPRLGEAQKTQANFSKLNSDTGWHAKVELQSWIDQQLKF